MSAVLNASQRRYVRALIENLLLDNHERVETPAINFEHLKTFDLSSYGQFKEIWAITLKFSEENTLFEMIPWLQTIDDAFSTNENTVGATFSKEGRDFMIGDGDDSGAVTMKNGVVRIWLRELI